MPSAHYHDGIAGRPTPLMVVLGDNTGHLKVNNRSGVLPFEYSYNTDDGQPMSVSASGVATASDASDVACKAHSSRRSTDYSRHAESTLSNQNHHRHSNTRHRMREGSFSTAGSPHGSPLTPGLAAVAAAKASPVVTPIEDALEHPFHASVASSNAVVGAAAAEHPSLPSTPRLPVLSVTNTTVTSTMHSPDHKTQLLHAWQFTSPRIVTEGAANTNNEVAAHNEAVLLQAMSASQAEPAPPPTCPDTAERSLSRTTVTATGSPITPHTAHYPLRLPHQQHEPQEQSSPPMLARPDGQSFLESAVPPEEHVVQQPPDYLASTYVEKMTDGHTFTDDREVEEGDEDAATHPCASSQAHRRHLRQKVSANLGRTHSTSPGSFSLSSVPCFTVSTQGQDSRGTPGHTPPQHLPLPASIKSAGSTTGSSLLVDSASATAVPQTTPTDVSAFTSTTGTSRSMRSSEPRVSRGSRKAKEKEASLEGASSTWDLHAFEIPRNTSLGDQSDATLTTVTATTATVSGATTVSSAEEASGSDSDPLVTLRPLLSTPARAHKSPPSQVRRPTVALNDVPDQQQAVGETTGSGRTTTLPTESKLIAASGSGATATAATTTSTSTTANDTMRGSQLSGLSAESALARPCGTMLVGMPVLSPEPHTLLVDVPLSPPSGVLIAAATAAATSNPERTSDDQTGSGTALPTTNLTQRTPFTPTAGSISNPFATSTPFHLPAFANGRFNSLAGLSKSNGMSRAAAAAATAAASVGPPNASPEKDSALPGAGAMFRDSAAPSHSAVALPPRSSALSAPLYAGRHSSMATTPDEREDAPWPLTMDGYLFDNNSFDSPALPHHRSGAFTVVSTSLRTDYHRHKQRHPYHDACTTSRGRPARRKSLKNSAASLFKSSSMLSDSILHTLVHGMALGGVASAPWKSVVQDNIGAAAAESGVVVTSPGEPDSLPTNLDASAVANRSNNNAYVRFSPFTRPQASTTTSLFHLSQSARASHATGIYHGMPGSRSANGASYLCGASRLVPVAHSGSGAASALTPFLTSMRGRSGPRSQDSSPVAESLDFLTAAVAGTLSPPHPHRPSSGQLRGSVGTRYLSRLPSSPSNGQQPPCHFPPALYSQHLFGRTAANSSSSYATSSGVIVTSRDGGSSASGGGNAGATLLRHGPALSETSDSSAYGSPTSMRSPYQPASSRPFGYFFIKANDTVAEAHPNATSNSSSSPGPLHRHAVARHVPSVPSASESVVPLPVLPTSPPTLPHRHVSLFVSSSTAVQNGPRRPAPSRRAYSASIGVSSMLAAMPRRSSPSSVRHGVFTPSTCTDGADRHGSAVAIGRVPSSGFSLPDPQLHQEMTTDTSSDVPSTFLQSVHDVANAGIGFGSAGGAHTTGAGHVIQGQANGNPNSAAAADLRARALEAPLATPPHMPAAAPVLAFVRPTPPDDGDTSLVLSVAASSNGPPMLPLPDHDMSLVGHPLATEAPDKAKEDGEESKTPRSWQHSTVHTPPLQSSSSVIMTVLATHADSADSDEEGDGGEVPRSPQKNATSAAVAAAPSCTLVSFASPSLQPDRTIHYGAFPSTLLATSHGKAEVPNSSAVQPKTPTSSFATGAAAAAPATADRQKNSSVHLLPMLEREEVSLSDSNGLPTLQSLGSGPFSGAGGRPPTRPAGSPYGATAPMTKTMTPTSTTTHTNTAYNTSERQQQQRDGACDTRIVSSQKDSSPSFGTALPSSTAPSSPTSLQRPSSQQQQLIFRSTPYSSNANRGLRSSDLAQCTNPTLGGTTGTTAMTVGMSSGSANRGAMLPRVFAAQVARAHYHAAAAAAGAGAHNADGSVAERGTGFIVIPSFRQYRDVETLLDDAESVLHRAPVSIISVLGQKVARDAAVMDASQLDSSMSCRTSVLSLQTPALTISASASDTRHMSAMSCDTAERTMRSAAFTNPSFSLPASSSRAEGTPQ